MSEEIKEATAGTSFKGAPIFIGKTTTGRVYLRQVGEKKFEVSTKKRYLGSAESPAACRTLLESLGFRLKTPKGAPATGEIATLRGESDKLKEMLSASAKNP